MKSIKYIDNELNIDNISFKKIEQAFSTPCYIYSQETILNNLSDYSSSLCSSDLVCYSVKSSNNLAILELISSNDYGFDVVSKGELQKALYAKANPKKIVFSGVGKTEEDLSFAIINKIKSINVESYSELKTINKLSKKFNEDVDIALRLNPEVSSKTHPFLDTGSKDTKFGLSEEEFNSCMQLIDDEANIKLKGLAFHIGSDIQDFSSYDKAIKVMLKKFNSINKKYPLEFLDVGGGLAIKYFDEDQTIEIKEFVKKVKQCIPDNINLIFEPGKSVIGNAGFLLTKVTYKKNKNNPILVIDAGMNDHIRVPLYGAKHKILPVNKTNKSVKKVSVVGPICESADYFDKNFEYDLDESELLVICSSGAYGFSMSSNYNARLKPPEVMIKEGKAHLIRKRETFEDLISNELNLK